jgi:type IV pilus assembly protein PilE
MKTSNRKTTTVGRQRGIDSSDTKHSKIRGFTLVELMIVVAIVGLLSSLAYPSFNDYVVRAKRQSAQETLYRVTSRQEQFFADNKTFARDLQALGYESNLMAINDGGEIVAFTTADKNYGLTIVWQGEETAGGTTLKYAIYAYPYGTQFSRDTKCSGQLLDESGRRWSLSGTVEECW